MFSQRCLLAPDFFIKFMFKVPAFEFPFHVQSNLDYLSSIKNMWTIGPVKAHLSPIVSVNKNEYIDIFNKQGQTNPLGIKCHILRMDISMYMNLKLDETPSLPLQDSYN